MTILGARCITPTTPLGSSPPKTQHSPAHVRRDISMRRNRSSSPVRQNTGALGASSSAVPPGFIVQEVEASEDVWGELDRLLNGADSESTPPGSPHADAMREAALGFAPTVRPDCAIAREHASDEGSLVSVPELKLEEGAFCLTSNGGPGEARTIQSNGAAAKSDNAGRNKRRGFIILDTEAASPSRHERRESLARSEPDLVQILDEMTYDAHVRAQGEGRLEDKRTQASDAVPASLGHEREVLPVTPEGAKGAQWDGWGVTVDATDDMVSIASTAEVGDHGVPLSSGPASHDPGAAPSTCAPAVSPSRANQGCNVQEEGITHATTGRPGAAGHNQSWHCDMRRGSLADVKACAAADSPIRSESDPAGGLTETSTGGMQMPSAGVATCAGGLPPAPNGDRRKSLDMRRPRKFDVSDVDTVQASEKDKELPSPATSAASDAARDAAAAAEVADHRSELDKKIDQYVDADPDNMDDIEDLKYAGDALCPLPFPLLALLPFLLPLAFFPLSLFLLSSFSFLHLSSKQSETGRRRCRERGKGGVRRRRERDGGRRRRRRRVM